MDDRAASRLKQEFWWVSLTLLIINYDSLLHFVNVKVLGLVGNLGLCWTVQNFLTQVSFFIIDAT